jgi:hypothetical protein
MRPRTISLLVTLGVFLGGLALAWALTDGGNKAETRSSVQLRDQVFTFPLNSTRNTRVSVRSHWRRGHMTPQDDQVELTLEGSCVTAHLYAYLSTGWDHGPLNAAAVILGAPLHPKVGSPPRVVRHDANSALVLSPVSGRGVLVTRASPRDFNALLVDWNKKKGCGLKALGREARELGRLFETFHVMTPGATTGRTAGLEIL